MRFKGHEQAKYLSFTFILLKMKLEHFSKLNLSSFNFKSRENYKIIRVKQRSIQYLLTTLLWLVGLHFMDYNLYRNSTLL